MICWQLEHSRVVEGHFVLLCSIILEEKKYLSVGFTRIIAAVLHLPEVSLHFHAFPAGLGVSNNAAGTDFQSRGT